MYSRIGVWMRNILYEVGALFQLKQILDGNKNVNFIYFLFFILNIIKTIKIIEFMLQLMQSKLLY